MKLNTIGKAVGIIQTIQRAKRPLSIKEIAEAMDFNKSSLHHHVKTLTALKFLQRDKETRKYDIGLGLVHAGLSYLRRIDVKERAHSYMEELSRNVRESVHLSVLDGDRMMYVHKVEADCRPRTMRCSCFIGVKTDLHSTAAGKVLLAHLDRTALDHIVADLSMRRVTAHTITDRATLMDDLNVAKRRGYALNLQEHVLGMHAVAVPVRNHYSQCIASISVACPIEAVSQETLETEILYKLQDTGRKVSTAMGYVPK
ncbi:MAG: IclR family transcriptional regulator [Spirochaetales bacterium]|nr:IclR family transcriptional regulator [Spirochaetales bacterium]